MNISEDHIFCTYCQKSHHESEFEDEPRNKSGKKTQCIESREIKSRTKRGRAGRFKKKIMSDDRIEYAGEWMQNAEYC